MVYHFGKVLLTVGETVNSETVIDLTIGSHNNIHEGRKLKLKFL